MPEGVGFLMFGSPWEGTPFRSTSTPKSLRLSGDPVSRPASRLLPQKDSVFPGTPVSFFPMAGRLDSTVLGSAWAGEAASKAFPPGSPRCMLCFGIRHPGESRGPRSLKRTGSRLLSRPVRDRSESFFSGPPASGDRLCSACGNLHELAAHRGT